MNKNDNAFSWKSNNVSPICCKFYVKTSAQSKTNKFCKNQKKTSLCLLKFLLQYFQKVRNFHILISAEINIYDALQACTSISVSKLCNFHLPYLVTFVNKLAFWFFPPKYLGLPVLKKYLIKNFLLVS